ncbi:hypothetical protein ACPW7J_03615 [Ihubacter sp. rT4E-8]|uniref:hypothetical protein n=1 Tax=Ihubacter sp. rT4E-8 TaxID=3242369 RepID=UPI003CE7DC32
MLDKPEICVGLEVYGHRTIQEYQWLLEDIDNEMVRENLQALINCVYKDGVKDGIKLYRQLDTN